MAAYNYNQLPAGTVFNIFTDEGLIQLTSRGPGRKWLDVVLNGDAAVLLCLSLASVMGPPCCHEHGTTWKCYRA